MKNRLCLLGRVKRGFVLTFAAGVLASACTMVPSGALPSKDAAAIKSKEAAIVLLRITGTDDGQPMNTWETAWSKTFISVAPVEITGRPAEFIPWVENRAPSQETRAGGWRYLILRPGSYRLFVNTPYGTSGEWRSETGDNQAPSFWLHVPRGAPVLYAGSLHLTCSTRWQGTSLQACASEVTISDETEAAFAIGRSQFADYGPVSTGLASRYGSPLPREELRRLASIEFRTNGYQDLRSPNWRGREHERYFGRGECARAGSGLYGPGCGGLVLLALLYWPIGSALEASGASAAEKAWGPCMARLAEDLREFDVIAQLRESFFRTAGEKGLSDVFAKAAEETVEERDYRGQLRLEILRAQFRQCQQTGTHCFELVVRAQLTDLEEGKLLYDTILDYSNRRAWFAKEERGSRATEHFVKLQSPCESLARFCGEGGSRRFEAEVRRAVAAITDSLTRRNGS